ncbi:diaminobutyrate--2-oxoglutarate transaminase [Acidihalobacter aeolianus]|uniref:Diaminobutyrate--2-oxoglutarate transaminase n=1 Tax=Acidihalobacter aeolianus TaxID=2792603 RepID=A0A1D8KA12_9GAMM|nr:diaminobutyrate--2-oxoglutarate transaminase [Acidihalobacter aeolianus]AOV17809.1 diaminobutyrate--2-oxoglutarate transaminase [Acidihalobacter aeolianus]
MMEIFETLESEVRGYIRSFPVVFDHAEGACLYDEAGRRYIDFFSGAGALNYGHNHPLMKARLIDYIERNGITHGLDLATRAKAEFLETFRDVILKPRGLDYRVQFPGPTGTNAVEAALKLARKVTGREKVISFTNAFHGMTLGALSVTGNAFKRGGAGVALTLSDTMPFYGYFGEDTDTIEYMDRFLSDNGSGVDLPAAVIVETIQAEGGINVADMDWLRRLTEVCKRYDMLLIVDDIQAGCGRAGSFFSFEEAGIVPDIVCLSKSLSGYGLPMAVTLIRPEYDQWDAGEHNGTFRGNNPAFVTATAALEFWKNDDFEAQIAARSETLREALEGLAEAYPKDFSGVRGRGLMLGLVCTREGLAKQLSQAAFKRGLIHETAGPDDEVAKFMPPLTIETADLDTGIEILQAAARDVLGAPQMRLDEAV